MIKFYDWLLKLSIGTWLDGCATFQKGNLSVSALHIYISRKERVRLRRRDPYTVAQKSRLTPLGVLQ